MDFQHEPVLLKETIASLQIHSGGIYVDCTLGGAGHSEAILKAAPDVQLVGIDQDPNALQAASKRLAQFKGQVKFVHSNFRHINQLLRQLEISHVDGILMDIGVSSHQLDTADRGFSYQHDAPLDMRMDPTNPRTARLLLNQLSEDDLTKIIRDYGEEKWARRIAQFIVAGREREPLETTGQLVGLIKNAIPASQRRSGPHPAKRTFQALRIAVNEELTVLEEAIIDAIDCLKQGGRIGVISFHSLEDRIVKDLFKKSAQECLCPPEFPICTCGHKAKLKVVTRKPVVASEQELQDNPRARSAKLRVAEKL